jgi:hypothetical protein
MTKLEEIAFAAPKGQHSQVKRPVSDETPESTEMSPLRQFQSPGLEESFRFHDGGYSNAVPSVILSKK